VNELERAASLAHQAGVVGAREALGAHHPALPFAWLDAALAIGVGGAEQPGDQVVGEERAAQLVRLLGVLAAGAGGEDDEPRARQPAVESHR
jgi:hypothetical protein